MEKTNIPEVEYSELCVTSDVYTLLSTIWHSLILIFRETSFTDLFWGLFPYVVVICGFLYFLANVQWKSDSGRGHRRSGSQRRHGH